LAVVHHSKNAPPMTGLGLGRVKMALKMLPECDFG
jgi:hypothetical protein